MGSSLLGGNIWKSPLMPEPVWPILHLLTVESVNWVLREKLWDKMKPVDKNSDKNDAKFACSEVRKLLPKDLLPYVTVLFQDSGYVTVCPRQLERTDWIRINDQVIRLGGIWVSNQKHSHWSIPFSNQAHWITSPHSYGLNRQLNQVGWLIVNWIELI